MMLVPRSCSSDTITFYSIVSEASTRERASASAFSSPNRFFFFDTKNQASRVCFKIGNQRDLERSEAGARQRDCLGRVFYCFIAAR
jgi:hypothetical protein